MGNFDHQLFWCLWFFLWIMWLWFDENFCWWLWRGSEMMSDLFPYWFDGWNDGYQCISSSWSLHHHKLHFLYYVLSLVLLFFFFNVLCLSWFWLDCVKFEGYGKPTPQTKCMTQGVDWVSEWVDPPGLSGKPSESFRTTCWVLRGANPAWSWLGLYLIFSSRVAAITFRDWPWEEQLNCIITVFIQICY